LAHHTVEILLVPKIMTTGLDETVLIDSLSKQSSHFGSSLLMFNWACCLAHLKTLAKPLISALQESICYFDNCICHQSCNCWLE